MNTREAFSTEVAPRAKKIGNVVAGVFIIGLVLIGAVVYLSQRESWRNAERLEDVQAITTALHQYAAAHGGNHPPGLDLRLRQIGTAKTGCETSTAQCSIQGAGDCLDLSSVLDPYLKKLPTDPAMGSRALTRYAARLERDGGFLVIACNYSE